MKAMTKPQYQLYNLKDDHCTICSNMSCLYRTDSFQSEFKIDERMGEGYWQRIVVNPSIAISIGDMVLHEHIIMGGNQQTSSFYNLIFCLGDELQWRLEGHRNEFVLACGESCFLNCNQDMDFIGHYSPCQRIFGINIELSAEMVKSIMMHHVFEFNEAVNKHTKLDDIVLYSGKITPNIRIILNQVINCQYKDCVKRLYFEGKILELIAVYLDEVIFGKKTKGDQIKLSKADLDALYQARGVLDENITTPPTISELAKLICLNEYKLKKGFKDLFGKPVHGYVIDRRLETARLLMEDKKLRVTDAALQVGYSDLSYFAEIFKKKYGVNPSLYNNG